MNHIISSECIDNYYSKFSVSSCFFLSDSGKIQRSGQEMLYLPKSSTLYDYVASPGNRTALWLGRKEECVKVLRQSSISAYSGMSNYGDVKVPFVHDTRMFRKFPPSSCVLFVVPRLHYHKVHLLSIYQLNVCLPADCLSTSWLSIHQLIVCLSADCLSTS